MGRSFSLSLTKELPHDIIIKNTTGAITMSFHDVCLNIHYSAPKEIWERIDEVYRSMKYYCKGENCLMWQGQDIELYSSEEPGGIQISGEMPDEIWDRWYPELKAKLAEALGYEIGEPQDGFGFKYWEPFVKSHADIKSIDGNKIVFSDLSEFEWAMFDDKERDITAKPPYFRFSSPLIELRIVFESTGLFAKKKQRQEFNGFMEKLSSLGINTLDLS